MAVARPTQMTSVEYLRLPESFPRTQLIDGEIIVTEASPRHQEIVSWLLVRLRVWTEAGLGRGRASISVDTQLDDFTVAAPDIWWSSEPNLLAPSAKGFLGGQVPDLVVEVLSPSTRRYDLGPKRSKYEAAGVGELWFVDPKAEIVTVLRRSGSGAAGFDETAELATGDHLTPPRLAGFSLSITDLFDR